MSLTKISTSTRPRLRNPVWSRRNKVSDTIGEDTVGTVRRSRVLPGPHDSPWKTPKDTLADPAHRQMVPTRQEEVVLLPQPTRRAARSHSVVVVLNQSPLD